MPLLSTALASGIAAGVAGLAAFLLLHAIWIVSVWSIAAFGLVVAWLGEPYFTVVDGDRVSTAARSAVAVRFVLEFLAVTTLSGALLGWVVTRTRRGTVAVAVAALAFALGPGHNLPFFHVLTAPAAARTAVLLTLAPVVVASAVFVATDALLSRERPSRLRGWQWLDP